MDSTPRGYWKDYLSGVFRGTWRALEPTDTLAIAVLIVSGLATLWLGGCSDQPARQIALLIYFINQRLKPTISITIPRTARNHDRLPARDPSRPDPVDLHRIVSGFPSIATVPHGAVANFESQ